MLQTRFIEELTVIYDTEKRIAAALPKLTNRGISANLRREIAAHAGTIGSHLQSIEAVFHCFGRIPHEAWHPIDEIEFTGSAALRSNHAALVSALLKAGQYEIALYDHYKGWEDVSYRVLLLWATRFSSTEAAAFLEEVVENDRIFPR